MGQQCSGRRVVGVTKGCARRMWVEAEVAGTGTRCWLAHSCALRLNANSPECTSALLQASSRLLYPPPVFSIELQRNSSLCPLACCYLFAGHGCLFLFPEALMGLGMKGQRRRGQGCLRYRLKLLLPRVFQMHPAPNLQRMRGAKACENLSKLALHFFVKI